MGRCKKLLESIFPLDAKGIQDAFNKILDTYFEDIIISDVEVDQSGGIYIEFADKDDDNDLLTYWHFNDDLPEVVILEPDEEVYDSENTEYDTVPLDGLAYETIDTLLGRYLDMSHPIWVDFDTMQSILSVITDVEEATRLAVRHGKKVRLPLIRRKRKKIRTPAQRMGMKRAVVKRRAKLGASKRKLAKSLAVRKRSGIHTQSLPRGYKVQGK